MATTNKIIIGIDDSVIELTGDDKATFEADRKQMRDEQALLEAEYKAKQEARENAIKKLAEVAGLTKEELASIL